MLPEMQVWIRRMPSWFRSPGAGPVNTRVTRVLSLSGKVCKQRYPRGGVPKDNGIPQRPLQAIPSDTFADSRPETLLHSLAHDTLARSL